MLKTLLKKEFLEFAVDSNSKNKKKSSKYGNLIRLLAVSLILMVAFGFFSFVMAKEMLGIGFDWAYFTLSGFFALIMGVIINVFTTYSGLYLAKDNEMLLSLPIPPGKIVISRMLSTYITGLVYSGVIYIPAIVFYWINVKITLLKIIFPVLILLILALLVLSLTCVFGWIVAFISSKLKNKSMVIMLISLTLLFVYLFGFRNFMNSTVEYMMDVDKMSQGFKSWMNPLYQLSIGSTGDVLGFVLFLAFTLVIFALVYLILSKSFIKIVTVKGGNTKSKHDTRMDKTTSISIALLKREFKRFIKSPTYMLNTALGVIMIPILTGFALHNFDNLLVYVNMYPLIKEFLPIVVVLIFGLATALDTISTPSISIEGNTLWIIKTLPIKTMDLLNSKKNMHIIVNAVPALICALIICLSLKFDYYTIVEVLGIIWAFIYLNADLGLIINLKKPKLKWSKEVEIIKQNTSVLVVIALSLLYLTVIAFGAYLTDDIIGQDVYLPSVLVVTLLALKVADNWIKKEGVRLFEAI